MLRTHRAGKGPGGCGRWGLVSRNRRGPAVLPTPGLRGQGTSPGSPASFLGSSGQGKRPPILSRSSQMAPPACLSWSPWPPSFAPRNHEAWMGLWRGDTGLGAQQAPQPKWAGQSPSAPLSLFPESPSCLPLLISPASRALILSGLHFSYPFSPPVSYQFILGFLPSPWASESPTSSRQAP